jgi:hypothetical protein
MVKYNHIFYDTSSFRNDGIFDNWYIFIICII